MTIQELQPGRGGDPDIVADLEAKIAALTDEADRLSGAHSEALAEADRFQRLAEQRLQESLRLRARAERWRRHLDLEQSAPADIAGEPINGDGDVQTVLFPRISYPIGRHFLTWDETPQRRCNGCLRILRDATEEEIEAANAGHDVADVIHECDHCAPNPVLEAVFGARQARDAS